MRKQLISLLIVTYLIPVSLTPGAPSTAPSIYAAKTIYCAKCGRKIKGQYILSKNRYYCSRNCLDKSKPKCAICRKPATIKKGDGKYFCSKICLLKTWPICSSCKKRTNGGIKRGYGKMFLCKTCATKPKCFACYMPTNGKLSDGRMICKKCTKTAIMTSVEAEKIAKQVRKIMREKLAIFTDHEIEYHLVGQKQLKEHVTHDNGGTELGLYRFEKIVERTTTKKSFLGKTTTSTEEKVRSKTHSIYFLYGIPKKKFIEVAAHELAHDWMQEYYPNIDDIKIKEGWAEFVASKINSIYGQSEMNKRMEVNKNKIYGDGFRMIKEYIRKYKIDGLLDMFQSL